MENGRFKYEHSPCDRCSREDYCNNRHCAGVLLKNTEQAVRMRGTAQCARLASLRIDDPELKLRRACAFTRPSASVLRDARRTPIPCSHEGSRIVDPTIPDPAAAARRLSAVWPNRRGILCSEHARPGRAACARRGWAVPQRRRRAAPSPTRDVPDPAARRSGRTCRDYGLRERKQAQLPAAIGSRADMAYSAAYSIASE